MRRRLRVPRCGSASCRVLPGDGPGPCVCSEADVSEALAVLRTVLRDIAAGKPWTDIEAHALISGSCVIMRAHDLRGES